MIIEYRGKRPKVAASAFIAPTAVLIGDVEVGEEASIWFGTVIRGDNGPIRIGARSSVQDNSVVHVSIDCETVIGEGARVRRAGQPVGAASINISSTFSSTGLVT